MKRGDKLTLIVEIELVSDKDGGSMTMAYSDCIAEVNDAGKNLGNVSGRLGATYEVHDATTSETWRMSPSMFWYAFQEARKAIQSDSE